jgi:hypothetical protein
MKVITPEVDGPLLAYYKITTPHPLSCLCLCMYLPLLSFTQRYSKQISHTGTKQSVPLINLCQ